nr:MAG TPA: hypothetical protein [Caudoviricetes sp.]
MQTLIFHGWASMHTLDWVSLTGLKERLQTSNRWNHFFIQWSTLFEIG